MNNSEVDLTFEQLLERDKDKLGELARIRESNEIAPEELLLAEFGLYYGFDAVLSVLENKITSTQMSDLVAGARRIESQKRYNRIIDGYLLTAATQDKKSASALKKHLKEISKTWQ